MFKRIKEDERYKKFKELRSNPKTKAIIDLGIWFVFGFIIILFLRMSAPPTSTNDVSIKKEIRNYEYTYYNDVLVINGQAFDDKLSFNVNNSKYYYDGKAVYLIKDSSFTLQPSFDLSLLKINLKMINNLTDNLTPTVLEDSKQYLVPLTNFINLYEIDTDIDLTLAMQYNIVIRKYEKDGNVYMIKLDLGNYYKIKGISNPGILTINLYNLNNVSDFTKGYEVGGK